jgi:hypothetical protein
MLTKKHTILAQKIALQVWQSKALEHHPDYIAEKINKVKSVSLENVDNIFWFFGQFSIDGQNLFYEEAKKTKLGQELMAVIFNEYESFGTTI